MATNSRPRRKFKPAKFFAAHRPTGESLKAKLARAEQAANTRPAPSLPRLRFLEFDDDDGGGTP
jgi:hypothetical protein